MAKKSQPRKRTPLAEPPDIMEVSNSEVAHMTTYMTVPWVARQVSLSGQWLNLVIKAVASAWEMAEKNPKKDLLTVFGALVPGSFRTISPYKGCL